MKIEETVPEPDALKDADAKGDTNLSETKSHYSDSSKLPDYIRFLCIYDMRVKRIVIMIGNLSSSDLDVDQIREDNQANIDKANSGGLQPSEVVRKKAALEGHEWALCLNEQKFLMIGSLTSVVK